MDFGNPALYASTKCRKWRCWRSQKAYFLLQSRAILEQKWFGYFWIWERKRVIFDTWTSNAPTFQPPNKAGTSNDYRMHQHAKQHHLKHSYDRLVSIPIHDHQKGQHTRHHHYMKESPKLWILADALKFGWCFEICRLMWGTPGMLTLMMLMEGDADQPVIRVF